MTGEATTTVPDIYIGKEKLYIAPAPIVGMPLDNFIDDSVMPAEPAETVPATTLNSAAAASQNALAAVDAVQGIRPPVMTLWTHVMDKLTNSFLWKTPWGNVLFFGGIAALIFWIFIRSHSTSSSSQTTTTPSSSKTTAARAELRASLDRQSAALAALGQNPSDIQASKQETYFVQGAQLALASHAAAPVRMISLDQGYRVVSSHTPDYYPGLQGMDMEAFLDSVAQPATAGSMLQNSIALHGMSAQKD
jgi:hypothetical protein